MTTAEFQLLHPGARPYKEEGAWFTWLELPASGLVIFGGLPTLDLLNEAITEFWKLWESFPPERRHALAWAPIS